MSEVNIITSIEFDAFIKRPRAKDEVSVIQFAADWCGPCKTLTSALNQEIDALEASGKVRIAKIDVGNEAALSSKYRIRTLPTILFFRNSEVIHEIRTGVTFGSLKSALSLLTSDEEDDF